MLSQVGSVESRFVEVRSVVLSSGLLRHGGRGLVRRGKLCRYMVSRVGHGSVCCDELGSSQVGRSS